MTKPEEGLKLDRLVLTHWCGSRVEREEEVEAADHFCRPPTLLHGHNFLGIDPMSFLRFQVS